ncbi:hypothetical protein TNCV_3861451 [Trichonephila clavipes]|nr:hypothetical protein TNCV_3861451 [Trichonephila clavipes]
MQHINQHNAHVWALENPHRTQPRAAQQLFSVNIWTGILGNYFIILYFLPSPLDGRAYLIFLQHVQLELLDAAMFLCPFVAPCGTRRTGYLHITELTSAQNTSI